MFGIPCLFSTQPFGVSDGPLSLHVERAALSLLHRLVETGQLLDNALLYYVRSYSVTCFHHVHKHCLPSAPITAHNVDVVVVV